MCITPKPSIRNTEDYYKIETGIHDKIILHDSMACFDKQIYFYRNKITITFYLNVHFALISSVLIE